MRKGGGCVRARRKKKKIKERRLKRVGKKTLKRLYKLMGEIGNW